MAKAGRDLLEKAPKALAHAGEGGDSAAVAEPAHIAGQQLAAKVGIGPTIMSMIAKRELEREELAARIAARMRPIKADIIVHPALLRRFQGKIARLREALNEEVVRGEAVATIRELVESVTINSDPANGTTSADLAASAEKLLRYAQNAETPAALAAGLFCSVGCGDPH